MRYEYYELLMSSQIALSAGNSRLGVQIEYILLLLYEYISDVFEVVNELKLLLVANFSETFLLSNF